MSAALRTGHRRWPVRDGSSDPEDVVASFDSASTLHAATVAALEGRRFGALGHSRPTAAAVRVAGHLPWPLLSRLYTRAGAAEGLDPDRLGKVDLARVAASFADAYPDRSYPGVLVGSSNGALAHLAAATGMPWLPGTVLVPVARTADPDRPDRALEFGARTAPALLEANPDVVLHHMHDQDQDRLMVARMTYFRTRWSTLPAAYAAFLSRALATGAPVVSVEDTSTWPVTRLGPRHVFQTGGQGGSTPADYLRGPHAPAADDEAPEAEWGAEPGMVEALARWCHENGHPLVRLRYLGPQGPSHAVASVLRQWYRARDVPADRLLVPSFVLADPWHAVSTALVPYWTFFPVQAALSALTEHLATSAAAGDPYRDVHVLAFQHGVTSPGDAPPQQWLDAAERHGARPHLAAVDARRAPHDIGALGRYGRALDALPAADAPWSPLPVATALAGLDAAGLPVTTTPPPATASGSR